LLVHNVSLTFIWRQEQADELETVIQFSTSTRTFMTSDVLALRQQECAVLKEAAEVPIPQRSLLLYSF